MIFKTETVEGHLLRPGDKIYSSLIDNAIAYWGGVTVVERGGRLGLEVTDWTYEGPKYTWKPERRFCAGNYFQVKTPRSNLEEENEFGRIIP